MRLLKSLFMINIAVITTLQAFKLGPQKQPIVFAFDIHGVLMRVKKSEAVSTSLKEIVKQPGLLLKIGSFFDGSAAEHSALRRIANSQQPICETWDLVKQIKATGYPIYIFSNIGEKTFVELMTKFPNWFEIFDGYHTVPSKDKKLRKPKPEAFASFKKMVHEKHSTDTRIIFIDDDKKNIAAAKKADFVTIHFSSAEQLKNELGLLA